MVEHHELIGRKVEFIRQQEKLRLENMPPEERDSTPADIEKVADAFEMFVNSFTGKNKVESFSKSN